MAIEKWKEKYFEVKNVKDIVTLFSSLNICGLKCNFKDLRGK